MTGPARLALAVAALLAAGVEAAAWLVPAYSGGSGTATPDGTPAEVTTTTATLVEVNGLYAAYLCAVPLVVTAVVAALLVAGPAHPAARAVAWCLVGLLGALALLAMFTIGSWLLPVVAALAFAVGLSGGSRAASTQAGG